MNKTCLYNKNLLYGDVIREVVNSDGIKMWKKHPTWKEGLMEKSLFQNKTSTYKTHYTYRPDFRSFLLKTSRNFETKDAEGESITHTKHDKTFCLYGFLL